jgi:predicted TIM-barrel fold metal-dependent hydrolase
MDIVDSLTHVTPDGRWFNTDYDASVDRLLREMDQAGVSKAVVVALAGYIENDFVSAVCRKYENRLIAGASINPMNSVNARNLQDTVSRLSDSGEFAVLKLHPRLHGYDPLDTQCLMLLEQVAAMQRPIPIWLDSFFYNTKKPLQKSPNETVHELSVRFPDITLVLLHAGGSNVLNMYDAIKNLSNVYLDISYTMVKYAGSSITNDLGFLLGCFEKRMLFGSDFPEIAISEALNHFKVLAKKLDTPHSCRVLGENILKIISQ